MTFPCRDARADANAGAVRIDGDQLGSRRVAVAGGGSAGGVWVWECVCVCACESISVSFAFSPLGEGGCVWLASSQAVRAGRLVGWLGWLGWAACMGELAAWAAGWLASSSGRAASL
jgi:hypothetical protein